MTCSYHPIMVATLLVLLDISAAFDIIDYNILLDMCGNWVDISGIALAQFKSYFSDHYHCSSRERGVISITSSVWSTTRLSTGTIAFHHVHATIWRSH